MSRPKVGVTLDPGAFIVPKEREGSCGGIQNLGASLRDFDVMDENYEFREKTTNPGMPRAVGASEPVARTKPAGGKLTEPEGAEPYSATSVAPREAQNFGFPDLEKLLEICSPCLPLAYLSVRPKNAY